MLPSRLSRARRLILVLDLAGYTRATEEREAEDIALFLDEVYAVCHAAVSTASGRVVKFIGDGMLAVFSPELVEEAIGCLGDLHDRLPEVARRHGMATLRLRLANLHIGEVVEGEFGPEGARHFDVIGQAVNHTFLLGARQGGGIHVSEPVYRALPNDRRQGWRKHRDPATYTLPR